MKKTKRVKIKSLRKSEGRDTMSMKMMIRKKKKPRSRTKRKVIQISSALMMYQMMRSKV